MFVALNCVCNSDSEFQMSITPLITACMHFLSQDKSNILVPKLFDFAEFYFVSLFYLKHFHVHVQCQQKNHNPWVHRSSGKLSKPQNGGPEGWD